MMTLQAAAFWTESICVRKFNDKGAFMNGAKTGGVENNQELWRTSGKFEIRCLLVQGKTEKQEK